MTSDDEILERVAKDGSMDYAQWPGLLNRILPRLEHVALNDFPLPKTPLPDHVLPSIRDEPPAVKQDQQRTPSPSAQKENDLPGISSSSGHAAPLSSSVSPPLPFRPVSDSSISGPLATLPPPLISLLSSIQVALKTNFSIAPPHTAQRLAELILRPTSHYRTLPSYLRALDRVISVSSPAHVFPLPEIASPFATSNGRALNGSLTPDSSDTSNADDFIGGAELTLIPWLNESSSYLNNHRTTTSDLRTESNSLIDGPNGAGSLETVTVTVNGIVRSGHARLRRRDEDVGATSITSRSIYGDNLLRSNIAPRTEDVNSEVLEERVTARGPDEIGMEDTGPQAPGSGSFDVEAALGRKGEGENMKDISDAEKEQQDGDGDYVIVDADDVVEDATPKADAT